MPTAVDKLAEQRTLSDEDYKELLTTTNDGLLEQLRQKAEKVTLNSFGKDVYIRGLIEVSNCCRNNCLYCGIRKGNVHTLRYRIDKETILKCCERGYKLGFRTFVLQGGEDPIQTDDWVEDIVTAIRSNYPDCAITLSIGEKSKATYQRFYNAGADRYLLRHETYNAQHYYSLHPLEMSRTNRLQCLEWLKDIGYQVGTGMMIGSPGQTIENLIEDIRYIERLQPQMIGIGPFIPHHDTPFANEKTGRVELTLRLISIFRLMNPRVLIPATTALATLDKRGREMGLLAGANVVMPNLSPIEDRKKYELYNNKAFLQAEAAEGLSTLIQELIAIDRQVSIDRGDYITI